jgi:hypothetical protein
MKYNIFFVAIITSTFANAQDIQDISRSRELTDIRSSLNLDGFREAGNKHQPNVDGSPYLFKSWNNNSKIFYEDKEFVITSFNYNVYSERFESRLSEDSIFIINPRNIKTILINDKEFGRYLDPEYNRNSYFEQITKFDHYHLLKKYTIRIKPGSINPLTKVKLSNDALVQGEEFYICDIEDNNSLKKIKIKKSTIQSLLDKENLVNVNNYVKQKGLNYNQEDDLKKIMDYYNTL